jgi:DNA repair protein SbcD/Mre11
MTLLTSRLLHLADLHLGQMASLEQFYVLQHKILNLCSSQAIDLVLIAGDLFDNHRLKDEFVEEAIDILMNLGPPVVILPGNHDCYEDDSPYKRANMWDKVNDHLNVLNSREGQDICIGSLHVWGKPVLVHDQDNRPLKNISDPREGMWNVAIGHGHVHTGPDPSIFSSIINPDEICSSGYDYVALGHWHRYYDVSCGDTKACYSGSPFGSAINGMKGTGVIVTFIPGQQPLVEPIKFYE